MCTLLGLWWWTCLRVLSLSPPSRFLSDHLFPSWWTSGALYIMRGLVFHALEPLPHCADFPLWQIRQIFLQILPTMTRPSYFKDWMANWTQWSYMHYCMVNSLILCLCMSVLINDGHRHVHRHSCYHLVEYLWARNISTMISKLKLNDSYQ